MLFAVFVACSVDDEAPPVDRCVWFADYDGDGYGQSEVFHVGPCSDGAPEGFVESQSDCADANASIHPGAIEGPDGVDRDCDGVLYDCPEGWSYTWQDRDGDGVARRATVCGPADSAFDAGGDCDDDDPTVGWSHDCVYATITTNQSQRGFGGDVAVADVDADGAGDVVVLSRRGVTAVMGTLAPGAEPGAATSQYFHDWPVEDRFAVADFAEEGSASVVIGTEWDLYMDWVRELAGEPVAAELASLTFFSISLGDVDGDGYGNDVVTRVRGEGVPWRAGMLEVTTFQGGAARAPARLISEERIDAGNLVGDLDGDGADNLVVTASTEPGAILWWGDAPTEGTVLIEDIAMGAWQTSEVDSIGTVGRGGDQDGDGYEELLIAPFVHREVWVASGAPGADLGDWIAVLRWEGPAEFPSLPTGTDLDGDGAADYWFPGVPPPPPVFGPVSGVVELAGDRSGLASALGDVDGDGAVDLVVEHHNPNLPVPGRPYQVLVYLGSPDW